MERFILIPTLRFFLKFFAIGFLLIIATGCATIVKGTTQTIPVASVPESADVTIDGIYYGQTPIDLEVKRKRNHLVVVEKEGFEPRSIPITKNVGGAVWGNILAGGLIGWGVDATSGAQYNLSPEIINVKLNEIDEDDGVANTESDASEFVTKLDQLDSLVENKTISKENYLRERCDLFSQYFPTSKPEESCPQPETSPQENAL